MSQVTNPPATRDVVASDAAIATAHHEMERIARSMVGDKLRRTSIEHVAYSRDNGCVANAVAFVAEVDEKVAPKPGADLLDALLDYLASHPDSAVRERMTVEIR